MTRRVLLLALVAAALAAPLFVGQLVHEPQVVSGFVEADEIRVGSLVGGRVAAVRVEEGQRVTKGQALLELEPFDLEEERALAAAEVAQARAVLDELRAGSRPEAIAQAAARRDELAAQLEELENGPRAQEIEVGRASVELARARLELSDLEAARAESLVASDALSRELRDRAITNQRVAGAELSAAQASLGLLEEGTRPEAIAGARARLAQAEEAWKEAVAGPRAEEIAAASAAVDAAAARLAAAERRLAETRVAAPVDGVVEAVDLQPGDLVAAGAPVLSLMDGSRLWVRAYVPEDRLDLRVGQTLEVGVDSFPGERFEGRLSFVARQAEFTPGNVQTPDERAKQVFRVHVDLVEGLDRLRPGMAADVYLGDPGGG